MRHANCTPALLLSLVALMSSSCEKETIPDRGVTISVTMSRSGTATNTAEPALLVFNAGYVIVREVVFDGEKNDGTSVSITEEKITTIDLATGVATPPFVMDIPSGTYTSVNLGIEIQDETSKPSIVAQGVYTNTAGVRTPVRFEFNSGEVFEADSDSPVTLFQNTPATAKIDFDPHVWFSAITRAQLDNAVRTNGVIIISETNNASLFDIVADQLDEATKAVFQ